MRNIDKLFGYPEFSAAPNLYETLADMHRMNSGVFVAQPSENTYDDMLERLDTPGVFWRRTDQTFSSRTTPTGMDCPTPTTYCSTSSSTSPTSGIGRASRWSTTSTKSPGRKTNPKRDLLAPLIDLWYRVLEGRPIPDDIRATKRQ